MKSLTKNIVIIGGLIAVAVAGYYLVVVERGAVINTGGGVSVSNADRETQEFLRRLHDIETIKLDTGIFSNPAFRSRVDFTGPIQQVPYGRNNPFSPQ